MWPLIRATKKVVHDNYFTLEIKENPDFIGMWMALHKKQQWFKFGTSKKMFKNFERKLRTEQYF